MKAHEIIETAGGLVAGARNEKYGSVVKNHENIAGLWNEYLADRLMDKIDPADVALMMVLLKVARAKYGTYSEDNFVDMAGYAGVAGECAAAENDPILNQLYENAG